MGFSRWLSLIFRVFFIRIFCIISFVLFCNSVEIVLLQLFQSNLDDVVCWTPGLLSANEQFAKPSKADLTEIVTLEELTDCDYYFVRFATNCDHSILGLGNIKGEVRLWHMDVPDPHDIPTIKLSHPKLKTVVRDLSFSRCGRDLVFCADDGTVWLYQRKTSSNMWMQSMTIKRQIQMKLIYFNNYFLNKIFTLLS